MYWFIWPLCKKSAMLVLVFAAVDLQRYRSSEGCINQRCDKPSCCGCVSKKWEQGEHEAVTLLYLVSSPSCTTYSENTTFKILCFPPLTGICSDTAVRSVLPLLFVRSLSSPIINIIVGCKIWSCHALNPRSIFHILGSLLPISYISV